MEHKLNFRMLNATIQLSGGSEIRNSIREAVCLSALEECEVTFEFNGKTIRIDARELIEEAHLEFQKGKPKR